ncbi:hypothetical protein M409DRAFT_54359 [Zasmidium cellare ATCC 36951]|uniref:Uncharacterized protein n=1 Tax=Zasmidium cellare ATCC 36951 TaxID=1080233 RepID=A0A6A6CIV6_ZASCE|nr:uncharacterized protein M409DRAFT_54359 [Zasmidium cellare ATCC 36951]KAF2167167.1 hypothetical protein M409DRAFT_54359 [Zasmidium cellare ATCC 36951]
MHDVPFVWIPSSSFSSLYLERSSMAVNRPLTQPFPRKSRRRPKPTTWPKSLKPIQRILTRELDITRRMLADNILASFTPGLVLVTAVSLRSNLSTWHTLTDLARATLLCILYTYIFDAVNQAKGTKEDKINKPYRPIP